MVHMDRMCLKIFLFTSLFFLGVLGKTGSSSIIQLNEDNWEQMLNGEWMVEFYAPWCPACKSLAPIWKDFSTWSEDLDIRVGQVDVTIDVGLSGRFMVTALPTIYHVHDGEFRQYRGARDKDEFISFIEESKWKQIDPIPAWKSPASYQMSVVSYFYKLSMVLRNLHTHLMEEYGVPMWGSYLIFAVITIIVGALLGLLLVCIIDCIYPPKPLPLSKDKRAESDAEDEEDDDMIKDDRVSANASASASEEEAELDTEEEGGEAEGSQGEDNSAPSSSQNSPSVRRRKAKPPRAD